MPTVTIVAKLVVYNFWEPPSSVLFALQQLGNLRSVKFYLFDSLLIGVVELKIALLLFAKLIRDITCALFQVIIIFYSL